jgi:hypothetical protein
MCQLPQGEGFRQFTNNKIEVYFKSTINFFSLVILTN